MINKSQLFEQLQNKTSTIEIDGMTFQVKGLSLGEVQEIAAKELDGVESALYYIIKGVVSLELDEKDLEELKKLPTGFVFKLAKFVQECSGLSEDEAFLEGSGKSS